MNTEIETLVGKTVQYFPAEVGDGKASDYEQDVITNGNGGPIAAIITRQWDEGPNPMVNLMVFPDFGVPVVRGSVRHRDTVNGTTEWAGNASWDFVPSN